MSGSFSRKPVSALRVSAIIPAHNSERYLGAAIESVLAQTYGCAECIVVDDGSTDGTERVARSFSAVRYVRQDNGGDANARNRGIREAAGDFVAFLDSDDVWLPRKIELQIACFLENPDVGMVYTGVHVADASLRIIDTLKPASGQVALRNTLLVEKPYMTGVGSSGITPISVARRVGFDERLKASADWAFACQVALRNRVEAVQAPLVLYRQHGQSQVHRNLAAVERDMRLIWSEIFDASELDPQIKRLQRRALANLYLSLAASYFKSGQKENFFRYLGRALTLRPDRVVAALWRRYMVPPS